MSLRVSLEALRGVFGVSLGCLYGSLWRHLGVSLWVSLEALRGVFMGLFCWSLGGSICGLFGADLLASVAVSLSCEHLSGFNMDQHHASFKP